MASQTYYQILGLESSATADQIESSYRKLALQLHPDKQKSATDTAFHNLCEIKNVLLNPISREKYDRTLHKVAPLESAWATERAQTVVDVCKQFSWKHGPDRSYDLFHKGNLIYSLSESEIKDMSVPEHLLTQSGRKMPGIRVIQNKLAFSLRNYVDENLESLQVGL